MGRIIFIRHGESEGNAHEYIANDDTPLTEHGKQQAKEVAAELRSLNIKLIVRSELLRARQTAEIIARELGISTAHIRILPELNERFFGDLKGKPRQFDSHEYYRIDGIPTVETRDELIRRMKKCLAQLHQLADEYGVILAVGHAVSGHSLIHVAKGLEKFEDFEPAEKVRIPNANYIEIMADSSHDGKS